MIELRPEVKEILEKHIDLIESGEWDTFFETIQNDYIAQIVRRVAETLEACNIFPLSHMTFIPEGYFHTTCTLTEYVVPLNIERICYKAFALSDIEKIQITGNVFEVDQNAFEGCYFLEKVVFDEGVKYIGDNCFYACDALEHVLLPQSLRRLGHNCFNGCDNLTEITYAGTMSDWNDVLNRDFINEGSYIRKINCSDGIIEL